MGNYQGGLAAMSASLLSFLCLRVCSEEPDVSRLTLFDVTIPKAEIHCLAHLFHDTVVKRLFFE